MPISGPIIAISSGGIPSGSSGRSDGSIVSMALDTLAATGSMMRCHTGRVCTSHSLRDHASGSAAQAGKAVCSSSQ
ncbi:unannotated protein [freshwater metagenome]|uniref:Unannotated protein n=1 Tax=freshwater metagenome TaxID=449393 RepID=A0A6J7JRP9_9ZZZZ